MLVVGCRARQLHIPAPDNHFAAIAVAQIAAVFEFAGAMLLGRVVTSTIAGGIADPAVFARQPEIYAYGETCGQTPLRATIVVWAVHIVI